VNKFDPGGNQTYGYDSDDFYKDLKDEVETVLPAVGKELANDAIIGAEVGICFVPIAGGIYGAVTAETWGGVAVSLGSEFLGPVFDVVKGGYRLGKAASRMEGAVNASQEIAAVTKSVANAAPEATITLHRGVSSMHPGYADALQGIAVPRAGTASVRDHVFGGLTTSGLTSWTSDFAVAEDFVSRGSEAGVVMCKDFPLSSVIESPGNAAAFFESEYLVQGTVRDVHIMGVPSW
jgi:hypothetical protein